MNSFCIKKISYLTYILALFLTSCGLDVEYFTDLYKRTCPESSSIPFNSITATSLCNGQPLLIALASSDDYKVSEQSKDLVEFMVQKRHADPNQLDPVTGRTPIMIAIDSGHLNFAEALAKFSKASTLDLNNQNFIYHLINTKLNNYTPFLRFAGPEIHRPTPQGSSLIQEAYKSKNYSLAWELIRMGADFSFLKRNPELVPVEFYFSTRLEDNPTVLDNFPNAMRARSSFVVDYSNSADGASLLHFAIVHKLDHLFDYLISRSIDLNVISSIGSPLALAIRLENERMVNVLLNLPQAIQVDDSLEAALHKGKFEWTEALLKSNAPLNEYRQTLLASCEMGTLCSEVTGWPVDTNTEVTTLDNQGNNRLIQALFSYYRSPMITKINYNNIESELKDQLLLINASARPLNKLGQNLAHFFMALIPTADLKKFRPWVLSNPFKNFVEKSKDMGFLDQVDQLGMTPLHHYLINPDRRINRTGFEAMNETNNLEFLLENTQARQVLTVNKDSILGLAVKTGRVAIVKAILKVDGQLKSFANLPNSQGLTPKQMAIKMNLPEIYALFK